MNAIQQAIEAAGGPSKLAAGLGVTPQAVCFWRDGLRRLPFEHGPEIERMAGGVVTRRQLFPDDWQRVWPEMETADDGTNSDPVIQSAPAALNPAPSAQGVVNV